MLRYENQCRDCATDLYPCRGNICPLRHVERHYCDDCGSDGRIYRFDDGEYCIECIEKRLEVVQE